MKKYSWLTPVSILVFVLGTLIFLSPLLVPKDSGWPIKQKLNLGLALKGGTQIVLGVKTDELPEADRADAVKNNIEIIRNRKFLPVPWVKAESRISPNLRFLAAGRYGNGRMKSMV